jgi:cell division protease FtsH
MVTVYGLNAKLGNISYYDSSGQEYSFSKPYSEKRSETIDDEVSKMIEGAYETAKRILTENKDKLTKLAETLLEKEVIFREDLEEIFGKRPFGEDEDAIEGIKGDYNAAKIEEEAKLREQGKKEEAERLDKEKSTNEERPRDLGDTFVQPPPPKDEDKPEDKQEV